MKDIFGFVGKILGLIFAAGVILFTSWLTYSLGARLIPDNPVMQAMLVILFDVGALTWFIQFIVAAKGTAQWAVSLIGFVLGLVGACIMAGAELIFSQQLVTLDDPTKLGWLVIACVIVASLAHASLVYMFHLFDPGTKNRIENAQRVSKVVEKAYSDARAEIDRQSENMGREVAQSLMFEAQAEIRAAALPHMRHGAQVIEATARDVEAIDAPSPRPAARKPAPDRLRWPWQNRPDARVRTFAAETDNLDYARLAQEVLAAQAKAANPLPGNGNGKEGPA